MIKQIIKMYNVPKKPKIIVYVDKREPAVAQELSNFECEVELKHLVIGDFILSDRVAVERKTAQDFISSVIDQRLFKQLNELKQNFEKPVLLIEGNNIEREGINQNVIRGALASIALDYSIPIIWTRDVNETAGMLYWIARREQLDEKRTVSIRGKKKGRNLKESQEFLVAGLPGISTVRAREILKHFGSPMKFFIAKEDELKKVKKVGPKTIKNIKKILG
jgi:ERCC4-type nuclease